MKLQPKHLLIIIAVLVVVVAWVVSQSLLQDPSKITRVLATGESDSEMSVTIVLLEGDDAAHEADHIFETLGAIPGTVEATFDTDDLTLEIRYDSALASEASIRRDLVFYGYLLWDDSYATRATLSSAGDRQSVEISDSGVSLEPTFILAAEGIPLDLVFGPGKGTRTIVTLVTLETGQEMEQDISAGGTLTLAVPTAGQYAIVDSADRWEIGIIVE
jgi:hypothetical protein